MQTKKEGEKMGGQGIEGRKGKWKLKRKIQSAKCTKTIKVHYNYFIPALTKCFPDSVI